MTDFRTRPSTVILQLIGNTPLIRLKGPSEATGCEILAKCEFMNPGGSVKDRAALFIVDDAEARGALGPGGVIVDGTDRKSVVWGQSVSVRVDLGGRRIIKKKKKKKKTVK